MGEGRLKSGDGATYRMKLWWAVPVLMSVLMALCSVRTPGVRGLVEVFQISFLYLPLSLALFFLHKGTFRRNIFARTTTSFVVVFVISQFLSAQLSIIHFRYKPLSTLVVIGPIFLVSFLWPVRSGRSVARTLGLAGVWLAVFVALILVADSIGGQWSFLIHKRQRFLGTVESMVKVREVPSIDAVFRGDGLKEKAARDSLPTAAIGARARPVVFVLLDTWRADTMSYWGGSGEMMPAVESLARKSAVFTDVVANSSWTKPSMASIITGLTPEDTGVVAREDVLSGELVTVAEVFRQAGYTTTAFMTNNHLFRGSGFDQGFDQFKQFPDHRGYSPAGKILDRFREWTHKELRLNDKNFTYLHFMDPHRPYLSPEQKPGRFRRHERTIYDREVKYFDGIFNSFIRLIYEVFGPETVLVLMSDHGEEFGEHGRWGHGRTVYPELMRVPLIVHGSEIEPGTIDARLEARDVFQLMPWLAGVGERDIRTWARDRQREVRVKSTYKFGRSGWRGFLRPYRTVRIRGVETEDWLMSRDAVGLVEELYERTSDPECMRNVASKHPDVVEQLWNLRREEVGSFRPRRSGVVSEEDAERLRALGYGQ